MKHLSTFTEDASKSKNNAFVNWIHSKAAFSFGNRASFVAATDKAADGKHIQGYVIASAGGGVGDPDHVYLHELTVLGDGSDHGKGFGAAVMGAIVKEADKRGITLRGAVQPLKVPGGKKIPVAKLRAFYKKFGFIQHGKHKDSIIRHPK